MEIEEFRKSFLEDVRAGASEGRDFEQSAFVGYALSQLEEMEEIADSEIAYFRGSGSKNRALAVDAYSFDGVDDSVRLVVADLRGQENMETVTQTEAAALFGRLKAFVEDSIAGRLHTQLEDSSPQAELAAELYKNREGIPRFRFYLVTDGALSARVRDWPEEKISGIPAEFHIWDIGRFHRVFESKTGRDELEVDFTEFEEKGIPCISASVDSGDYQAYLCVIPGDMLAGIYDRYGSRLLEGNVRSFLSIKGKVNKGIRNTILNEPTMFFAYNNGIAVTATGVEIEKSGGIARLKKAKNLQIVNGGQTTASLANGMRKDKADLKHIFVQMKLSVVPPETSETIIPLISRYANSQNKVSDADFFSNHPFHQRIEEISRRVWARGVAGAQYETHWFYERARGQYLNAQSNLTVAKKGVFLKQHPKEQLITKTDLAKFENAWRGLPHRVSLGAQKNFMIFAEWVSGRWDQSDADFSEDYFHRAVAKAILYRNTERMVSVQTWYDNAYRAQIVAYSVAKLADLIGEQGGGKLLDLRGIWLKQMLSPGVARQLIQISEQVFRVIINPAAGFQNVGEWCKKELCWQRVKELSLDLVPELRKELIGKDEDRILVRTGKKQQIVDTGIVAQTTVFELGGAYWSGLYGWAKKQNLLSVEQDKLLYTASQIPRKVPNDLQSEKLLEIKEEMELEGYKPAK